MLENGEIQPSIYKKLPDWLPKTPEEREKRRQARLLRKNYFNREFHGRSALNPPLIERAARWLLPWASETYPGIGRGLSQVLGERVKYHAVRRWRAGTGQAPIWAVERFTDEIERRCREGLEIVAALRVEIIQRPPPKPRGLEIRDPETGLPKYRHRLGSGAPGTPYARRKERQAAERRLAEERKL